ncbi:hypothetical protein Mapa_005401 [Marchantia paleacea]|nr:hypothetical protein Mapa_005401 [Marchantia paleacea]
MLAKLDPTCLGMDKAPWPKPTMPSVDWNVPWLLCPQPKTKSKALLLPLTEVRVMESLDRSPVVVD